jgi:serine/threonine protein kinase/class 3 adenylate cyclase
MAFHDYELLAQLGAGPDGVAYQARNRQGETVLLREIAAARNDSARWPGLSKRLRTAALLTACGAQAVIDIALDHEPPYIATEWVERVTLAECTGRFGSGAAAIAELAYSLALVLIDAHRLGLAHGAIWPDAVLYDGSPRLDFTGLRTETASISTQADARSEEANSSRVQAGNVDDPRRDLYQLGLLLTWVRGNIAAPGSGSVTQSDGSDVLECLIRELLADDPLARPTAREVVERLRPALEPAALTIDQPSSRFADVDPDGTQVLAKRPDGPAVGDQLGRYRLLELLGQGGMGSVFRGEDITDGAIVAIKVLRAGWGNRPDALRRFRKEARLLAEVNNPYVTNLLEVNEDRGTEYLVLEFVAGRSLGSLLAERGRLDEPTALAIAADVARALADAHDRGIVHRDIKPDNILLTPEEGASPPRYRVKVSDFGLARHVVETESLQMTQASVVGTPQYMAPEQCTGGEIDPRTDVYALGATLYHLLAGRPPFTATTMTELFRMHLTQSPPALAKFNPEASGGVTRIIERALSKAPDERQHDAGVLLRDLERLLRGEPNPVVAHPVLPTSDPAIVMQFDFRWNLGSAPRQLWPHVSNTERLNRAIGLPAVEFTAQPRPDGGARRFAAARLGGLPAEWEEHPFEWVEPRRFGVLREYSRGPFKWVVSLVELVPMPHGGTTLWHRVRIEPRNSLLRPVIANKIGKSSKKMLERVYRRIDAAVSGHLGREGLTDPFEDAPPLAIDKRRRLERLLDRLVARGIATDVVESLGEFLATAPAQEVARIRPLALARRLGLNPDQVVSACLIGASEGLLVLLWDLLCPVCRIPSAVSDTLRNLRDHGRCAACNLDYELDFASAVELIFRAHPEVRDTELGVYCVGGPAHSPHVVAQVRVAPGERLELDLGLSEGTYRLRGPQLPAALEVRVEPGSLLRRVELSLGRLQPASEIVHLRPGRQTLILANAHDSELLVRIERSAPRADALTAARASTLALFRDLFPQEILARGRLVNVATITLLVTDLGGAGRLYEELGDARAFALIEEHFRHAEKLIAREGGALIKTVGEGIVAAFSDAAAAARAAWALASTAPAGAADWRHSLRIAVHRGPAMAATLNDHLDYFGATVQRAHWLLAETQDGEILLSQAVAADPDVADLLRSHHQNGRICRTHEDGVAEMLVHRLRAGS